MSDTVERQLTIPGGGDVGTILRRPANASCLLVLAHGAGAGMRHRFMDDLARTLAAHTVATLRYEFPYVARGSRRPDPLALLMATVRAAVDHARDAAGDLALYAGGKSMGGRMTSNAAAEPESLPGVRGIVFVGFPLHPAGRPGTTRAEHLARVTIPMLFLQGTRDKLAELDLLQPIVADLGSIATLSIIDGADHGFDVLKRSGRTAADVLEELAEKTARWMTIQSP